MSPGMVAPLLVLAALLVFPGRMPEDRGVPSPPKVTAHVSTLVGMTHAVTTVWHRLHGP